MVVLAFNSSTWDAEARGPKFKAILGYLLRFCIKKNVPPKKQNNPLCSESIITIH